MKICHLVLLVAAALAASMAADTDGSSSAGVPLAPTTTPSLTPAPTSAAPSPSPAPTPSNGNGGAGSAATLIPPVVTEAPAPAPTSNKNDKNHDHSDDDDKKHDHDNNHNNNASPSPSPDNNNNNNHDGKQNNHGDHQLDNNDNNHGNGSNERTPTTHGTSFNSNTAASRSNKHLYGSNQASRSSESSDDNDDATNKTTSDGHKTKNSWMMPAIVGSIVVSIVALALLFVRARNRLQEEEDELYSHNSKSDMFVLEHPATTHSKYQASTSTTNKSYSQPPQSMASMQTTLAPASPRVLLTSPVASGRMHHHPPSRVMASPTTRQHGSTSFDLNTPMPPATTGTSLPLANSYSNGVTL